MADFMTKKQRDDETANLKALLAGEAAEREALQKELHLLQERFNSLFTIMPVGLAIIDTDFRYFRINEELARMSGLPAGDHLGKNLSDILPYESPLVEHALQSVVSTGEALFDVKITGEAKLEPGVAHQWSCSFLPLRSISGALNGLAVLVIDVSDYQHAETTINEIEMKYRMLMQQSSDAVFVFDERGNFTDVNPRACEMLGYTREELLRLGAEDLIPFEDLAHDPADFSDLLTGKTVRKIRRLRGKDGAPFEVEIVGSMVGGGRMQSIVRSLSEEKKAGLNSHKNTDSAMPVLTKSDALEDSSVSIRVKLLKEMSAALTAAADMMDKMNAPEGPSVKLEMERSISFYDEVSRFEIDLIHRALQQANGKQKDAAKMLGINQTTLHNMIKRYKINLDAISQSTSS